MAPKSPACSTCAVVGTPATPIRSKPERDYLVMGTPPNEEVSILDGTGKEYVYVFKEEISDDGGDLYDSYEFDGDFDYESEEDDEDEEDDSEEEDEDLVDDYGRTLYISGKQAGYDPETKMCRDEDGSFIACSDLQ